MIEIHVKNATAELRSSAVAFAKGGDSEEHFGGVFVPSPCS